MRILVAGGAGYIGSCTTEYLLDHGHQVTVFDALITGHRAAVDQRAGFAQGNLNDDTALDAAFQQARPEGIIHFAAFIEVGESMRQPGSVSTDGEVDTEAARERGAVVQIVTHLAQEKDLSETVSTLRALDVVVAVNSVLRVEVEQ